MPDCFRSSRNESRSAQIIAWSLAIAIVLLILVLIAFVCVLLAGSTLISRGASEGGGAVSQLLPEVARVRDEAVEGARREVLGRYDVLLQMFYDRVGYVVEHASSKRLLCPYWYNSLLTQARRPLPLYKIVVYREVCPMLCRQWFVLPSEVCPLLEGVSVSSPEVEITAGPLAIACLSGQNSLWPDIMSIQNSVIKLVPL